MSRLCTLSVIAVLIVAALRAVSSTKKTAHPDVPLCGNAAHQAHSLSLSFVAEVFLQHIVAAEHDVVQPDAAQESLLSIF